MNDLLHRIREGIMDGWSGDYPCLDGIIAKEAADHIEAQEKLIEEMTKALVFYSHEPIYKFRNVTRSCGCCSDMLEPEILLDEGAIAREILSKSNPNTPERNDE